MKPLDTVELVYDSRYYQDGSRHTHWRDGHVTSATVLAVLGNAVMIVPWCNGTEMLVPKDKLTLKAVYVPEKSGYRMEAPE